MYTINAIKIIIEVPRRPQSIRFLELKSKRESIKFWESSLIKKMKFKCFLLKMLLIKHLPIFSLTASHFEATQTTTSKVSDRKKGKKEETSLRSYNNRSLTDP